MRLMKKMIILLLAVQLFAPTALAMSPAPTAQPAVPALTDNYAINDKVTTIGSYENFSVFLPGNDQVSRSIQDSIIDVLSQKGYLNKHLLEPTKNRLIFTFHVTNEVRTVDVMYNEQAYAVAARVFKDPYIDQTPFANAPNVGLPSKPLVKKSKITAPVEAVTIRAYIFSNENTLAEVWECAAASLEGTSQALPSLVVKALSSFPDRAK